MRRARSRLTVAVLGVLLAGAGAVSVPAAAGVAAPTSGACTGSSGVTVVVDFTTLGGGVQVRCAAWPVTSGLDALTKAGFTWTGTHSYPGLLCRIDGKPANDPCFNAPPSKSYWGYWHATRGGSWTYSTSGAGSFKPANGSVEGWAFGDSPPPGIAPPAKPSSPPTTTSRPPASTPTTAAVGGPTTPPTERTTTTGPGVGSTTTAMAGDGPTSTVGGADDATTSTTGASDDAVTAAASGSSSPSDPDGSSGGSPVGVLVAVVVVGVLGANRDQKPPSRSGGVMARLPRMLHPGAWWLWAMGMAAAASRTTNPLLLALLAGVVCFVVSARRTEAPWSSGFRLYVYLGLMVIVIRVVFRIILDGQYGAHLLFTLPEVPLPEAAAGIRLGGEVSAEGVLLALFDGMRLAVILLCVGAANVLANPKRLLKAMPAALHEVGVAITVALSVASQLLESGQRVRKARRLRAGAEQRRWHVFKEIAIPVMTDALDRSLLLAAGMDSRGYGRAADLSRATRTRNATLLLGGLIGICIGSYGLLDATAPDYLGASMLVGGMVIGGIGVALSGARVPRTRYRPDPWRAEEWAVGGIGLVVAGIVIVAGSRWPVALFPGVVPLRWPELPLVPAVVIGLGCLPAWIAPPVTMPARRPHAARTTPVEAAA